MISIISVSMLINKPIYSLFFFLFFFILRLFCGGYHASTYLKCFVTTNLVFISTIILTELIIFLQIQWIMPAPVIISTAIVWIFAPIRNKNHPCSEETHLKNKIKSRSLSSFCMIFFCFFFFLKQYDIAINSGLSFIMVSVMIIIEKIRLLKEVKNNELYQF